MVTLYFLIGLLLAQSIEYNVPDKEQFVTEHFTTADGLGESMITDIVRDTSGYLWISHQSGVTRFDGYTFKNYSSDTGSKLEGRSIRKLHIDRDETLWAISEIGQINKYNPELQDFSPQPMAPDSLRDHDWYEFAEFSPDTVLLQFIDKQSYDSLTFLYYSPSTQEYGHLSFPITEKDQRYIENRVEPDEVVLYFFETSDDGTQWLGINNAVFNKSPSDSLFNIVRTRNNPDDLYGVRDIFFESDGLIWFSSVVRGMMLYNRNQKTVKEYRFNPPEEGWVNHYIPDAMSSPTKPEELWLGTRVSSLVRFNTKTRSFDEIDDRYNRLPTDIMCVYIDDQGILWVGTKGEGLAKINPLTLRSKRLLTREEIDGEEISLQILQMRALNDSTIFVSTYENGYYLMNHEGEILFHTNEVSDGKLPHLSVWSGWDGRDKFWISTSYKLASFNKDVYDHDDAIWQWYPIQQGDSLEGPGPDLMRATAGDKKNRFWAGSRNGLYEYSGVDETWKKYESSPYSRNSIAEDFIISLFYDELHDQLWVGHNTQGVSVINWIEEKAKITRLMPEDQRGEPLKVYGFKRKESGNMVVTTDQGVFEIDPQLDNMTASDEFSHLMSKRVNSIYKDSDNRWWAGTNRGIIISDQDERVVRLDERDGMLNREVSYSIFKSNTGELWAATNNGIVIFESDSLTFPSNTFDIEMVSFDVLGSEKRYKAKDEMVLNYDENNFKLSVSNFDMRDPESQQWFFKLNGYSDRWLPATDKNIMQFTNLSPGTFEMDVRVESKYGYSQVKSSLLTLTIEPAFWQTSFFQSLIAIVFFGIAGGYIYQRYRYNLNVRQERKRIMGDLHDDLSSVLASINFNINTLNPGQNLGVDKFDQLQSSSDLAVETMRDLMWSVDPKKDDWGSFIKACQGYIHSVIGGHHWNIDWNIDGDEQIKIKPGVRKQLFLVFKEIMTNILKHADAKNVTISLDCNHNIRIVISDDGIGFDSTNIRNSGGVGLKSVSRRLEELNATFDVTSSDKNGTCWQISVPLES